MGFNYVNCFIVLHLGARFTMEIYGLMLDFGTFLRSSYAPRAQVKIVFFANVLEHNNIRLNDTLN